MKLPLDVTFRNLDHSEAVEALVREESAKLERHFDHIVSCRVTIEAPHRHQTKEPKVKGELFQVHIELGVPQQRLIVSQKGKPAQSDLYKAVRDAFKVATRQLEDYARKLRGDVKSHAV
ncbi:MAG: HPF/RaiA family ribosome-associated protein [Tistlia sp.]|uniref:HPF/RaiA family ribosome-associated protein n=1 Tax=Tistlia sp. TaxID=3057121 RepID=UPI0034A2EE15